MHVADCDCHSGRHLDKPLELRHPFIFYLGHLPAFTDARLARVLQQQLTEPADYATIFARGIDPDLNDPSQCKSAAMWLPPLHISFFFCSFSLCYEAGEESPVTCHFVHSQLVLLLGTTQLLLMATASTALLPHRSQPFSCA
jgi:hypothetical protein